MNKDGENPNGVPVNDELIRDRKPNGPSRRQFLGGVSGVAAAAAFNISLGHGIHAGIHFRSSTFWSILLGEQVALSILRDRAKSCAEPFTITITKFDGTSAEISNE